MALLWQRLPAADPMKARLYEFLHQPASPVRFLLNDLEKGPLVRGTGEFGSGCTINDVACNVVQNGMVVGATPIMTILRPAWRNSRSAGSIAFGSRRERGCATTKDGRPRGELSFQETMPGEHSKIQFVLNELTS